MDNYLIIAFPIKRMANIANERFFFKLIMMHQFKYCINVQEIPEYFFNPMGNFLHQQKRICYISVLDFSIAEYWSFNKKKS